MKHRALLGVFLHLVACMALLFVALVHPFLILRVIAAIGAVVAAVFVAYWIWWFRFYARQS
ncbi:MAG TPA: hypothetical protein VF824_12630 [Thermoanaerobaculia bacterium]|jgi:Flp pilus assembly protein TadB